MRIASTQAKIGRSIKNWGMERVYWGAGFGAPALDTSAEEPSAEAYGTAFTSDSGRAFCVPDTMTRSPSLTPLETIQFWPMVVSAVTCFWMTLLSVPTGRT